MLLVGQQSLSTSGALLEKHCGKRSPRHLVSRCVLVLFIDFSLQLEFAFFIISPTHCLPHTITFLWSPRFEGSASFGCISSPWELRDFKGYKIQLEFSCMKFAFVHYNFHCLKVQVKIPKKIKV